MSHRKRGQKTYIDSCWNEVERPKRKIRYISKVDRDKNFQNKQNTDKQTRRVEKMLMKIFIVSFFLSFSFNEENKSIIKQNPDRATIVTNLIKPTNTYIDGLGFAEMMRTLREITEKHNGIMETYILSNFSFTEDGVLEWMQNINTDLTTLENMTYDESYEGLINCYIIYLYDLQELVLYMEDGNTDNILMAAEKCSIQAETVQKVMIDSLEKNGINYTNTEKGITYQFNNY